MSDEGSSRIAYEQEMRLAVVLYGGVSLAIYINGVAQELLRLVRATAPLEPGSETPLLADDALDDVERLYRELGCRLAPENGDSAGARGNIRTRFVVDVISGTSAGGINGIFLACALARHQDMEQLHSLWVSEGEMSKLLNDAGSVGDLDGRLEVPREPRSLLNSRRMYLKLFEALEGMRSFGGLRKDGQSALVDELDLFVTATDLRGLLVKLRLTDRIVYERRYRNSFHFVHATEHGSGGEPRNDLRRGNNPFLAFAARCTSSFPVAFEPMTLDQAIEVLGNAAQDPEVREARRDWPEFYRDYRDSSEVPGREKDPSPGPFGGRAFGDGGYLDNKPFGLALGALRNRRADLPVKRKLVYVEPSPEHPELDRDVTEPPDAIENLLLAASVLPRQETIREDLEWVLERNRQVDVFHRAVRYVGQDFNLPPDDPGIEKRENRWGGRWLHEVVNEPPAPGLPGYGGGYGAYHRLKVSQVTSDMAELVARIIGLDLQSDEVTAVRYLMSAWRQHHYLPNPDPRYPEARPENEFLVNFDLGYRLRRLHFIQHRLTAFVLDQRHADEILRITGLARDRGRDDPERPWSGQPEEAKRAARASLRVLRRDLAGIQISLRAAGRALRQPSAQQALREEIAKLGIGWAELKAILKAPDAAGRVAEARRALGLAGRGDAPPEAPTRIRRVDTVTEMIATELRTAFQRASDRATELLHPVEGDYGSADLFRRVRHCLWHQYRRFDYFDMMLFPMLSGTQLGELEPVEVLRVSPEDATRLIEERDPEHHRLRRSKLAGTRLGNFGAFLDPIWRRSDILWGRLDAAERIVNGFAPEAQLPEAERNRLLGRLHAEIVRQEIVPLGIDEGRKVFVEALLHTRDRMPDYAALTRMLDAVLAASRDPLLAEILDATAVRDVYSKRFRDNLTLDREKQVRLMARGSQVVGRLMDALSKRYAFLRKRGAWTLVTVGRILNGLVEVSVPRSVWELFGIYWLSLLYAFEVLMAVAGQLVPGAGPVRDLGLMLLAITFAADLARRLFADMLRRGGFPVTRWTGVVLGLGVLAIGAVRLWELGQKALGRFRTGPGGLVALLAVLAGTLVVSWICRRVDEGLQMQRARRLAEEEREEERRRAEAVRARSGKPS